MSISKNLEVVKKNIQKACEKVNRNYEDITIVAVTKYVDKERTEQVIEAGVEHLGENRDHQFLEKYATIGDKATWHFVGTLQSRKVRDIIDKVEYIHSLDRISLAKEINKRAHKPMKCFVQVNVAREQSKHGLMEEELIPFVKQLEAYENIHVIGLMTMAPYTNDEQVLRSVFRTLKSLQQEVKKLKIDNVPCTHLSMGMSNDYTIAVEEGATFIRLGSSLVESNQE